MTCETRRLLRARPRTGAALLALPILWGCAREFETRRLTPPGVVFEAVERNAVTRSCFAVSPNTDAPLELVARDVGPGSFTAWLALRGARGGTATARIELDAGAAHCEIAWDEDADAGSWRGCEIPLPRGGRRLRVEIRYDGPADSELLVAAPVFEASAARAAKPPVFVIVLDTARADGFRSFNPESAIGAHLATLERDGIIFSRARSPSGWTRTAVATLLTGQSPFRHRVLDRLDVLAPEAQTLARLLRDVGYRTLGWTTNPNVLARWGFARGFDAFEDVGTRSWALVKPDGDQVLDLVEAEIARDGTAGRFFYLHLMDPHQPYRPKASSLVELDRLTGKQYALPGRSPLPARTSAMRGKFRSYLGEILESDQQVGRLLDLLRGRGEFDASLIAVVSDHGEEFLDHAGSGHGKTLYEEMLRVPVWLKLPEGRRAGTRIDADVDLADLLPTLLGALGMAIPPERDGADLLAQDATPVRPHLARLELEDVDLASVVQGDWKLIIDYATNRERLYALATDPGEETDLREAHPERAAALRSVLENGRLAHEQGWHVRGCGGTRAGGLAFRLELGAESVLTTRRLEAEDRVASDETGAVEIALDLPRTEHPTERVLAAVRPTLADEDELLISGTPRELRTQGSEPLRFVVGAGEEMERAQAIAPKEILERARIPAGRSLRCVERDSPYLQIFYLDVPQSAAGDVDPALAERLRALGYGE